MKLVIAEKPSVAQSLAAVIGAATRKDGYLEGNGWRVSWCVGHLAGLADADAYNPDYAKWRYDDLPILPDHWQMVVSKDKSEIWDLLCKHVAGSLVEFVDYTKEEYSNITNAFINEDLKSLRRSDMSLRTRKSLIKKVRRKEMIGLQRVDKGIAIEKNTWFHLGINSCLEIYYCLRRICEPCEEHVDNNFEPLPKECIKEFIPLRDTLVYLLEQTSDAIKSGNYEYAQDIRMEGDKLKESFSVIRKIQMNRMQDEDTNLAVSYVYLNMLQESQEIVASLRHLLRAANRFKD